MNIVFLDIDGVLASWLKMGKNRDEFGIPFEQAAIDALNEITKLIDGKIVISSTWRKTRKLEEFQNGFWQRGITADVVGMTPELDTGRADEIQQWIDENDVDYFVIIDDNTRGIEERFKENMNVLRTNLYRCLDHYDFLYVKRGHELYTYGVDNVSQLNGIKKKKAETFMKHYGVDNIRKSEEFKSWLKEYMKETYGVGSLPNKNGNANSWGWKNLSLQEKQERLKELHSNFESGIEKKIQGILADLKIPFSTQFFIANRSFDIKISKSKKIIEVNGDYWHANPEIYKKDDIISNKYLGNITAEEIWKRDFEKKELAESKGYEIFYIWEKDIKTKSREELEIILLDFLFDD